MQTYLAIILITLLALFFLGRWFVHTPSEKIRATLPRLALLIAAATLILLVVTGRLHWFFAIIGGMIPVAMRFLRLWQVVKVFKRPPQPGNVRPKPGAIPREEAYEILGLKPGASKEEIIEAHRKLIQKIHPDRGGSAHLAGQINKAKETLLGPRDQA